MRLAPALVLVATAFGAVVRLWPALTQPFPVETGGLFYAFIRDILANHFALPSQTTYNGGLPFAYPPLSFYVAAAVCAVTRVDPLALLRWLPSILAALTVPAIWLLARRMLAPLAAAWATVAFAVIPVNLELLEGGGGLPRAMGLLLAVLGLEATLALRDGQKLIRLHVARAAILLAAAAACHPEIALFAAVSAALLFVSGGHRNGDWFMRGAALALVFCGLTALWLVPDLLRHGLDTYRGASSQPVPYGFIGGAGQWLSLHSLTGELAMPAVQIAALVGAVALAAEKRPVLLLWLVAILLVDQRAPTLVVPVPVALLAGYGIAHRIAPMLRSVASRFGLRYQLAAWAATAPLALSGAYTLGMGMNATSSLTSEDLGALQWAGEQTDPSSSFLIIPGGRLYLSEWFPALSSRRSVVAHEGTEWLGTATFARNLRDFNAAQRCSTSGVSCLETWRESTGRTFDYVLVARDVALAADLEHDSPEYTLAYSTPTDEIFRRTPCA